MGRYSDDVDKQMEEEMRNVEDEWYKPDDNGDDTCNDYNYSDDD